MYEIIETDFSIFKDKTKVMELFSPNNVVHKIVLLHYTLFEVVAIIEVPKINMEYVPSSSHYTAYLPLNISKDAINYIGVSILPHYWNSVYFLQDFYINHDFSKQIVREELKYFKLKLKDVPQQFLPTNKFDSKELPNKYLPEITNLGNKCIAQFYDKHSIGDIKNFYQLLEDNKIEKFSEINNVIDWMDKESYNKAYEKYLKEHPNIANMIIECEEKNLSIETTTFMENLYSILYSILTVTDQRIAHVIEKLQNIYHKITPYTWQYLPLEYENFHISPDPIIEKVAEKFGGIYNYKNRQYDYENIWDKRELNDDGSVKMSELETEIQELFPDGCYPFSEYQQSADSLIKKIINKKLSKPMWFPIMQLAETDCYYLDYEETKNKPVGQVIRVTGEKVEVVAQNYLIFMEQIMIPKIEEIIEKHKAT
ncbi:hypothetical protein [Wohlfahrtiimonas larvae]|uniref:Knr4/Smi1-like domain-containing protein n=1 Tax=Wohlfahrtiimonas larvae TaxID=1157986 RepID=A0ABP9MIJ6_9GAMM|nr:hypothetical protein [Wohlfahrtiimonas larvae]